MRRDDWRTPKKLFQRLQLGWNFTVEAAASEENHLLDRYWSEKDDAIYKVWHEEIVFCNPPYSRAEAFTEKFLISGCMGVLLLPVRSDRLWFQEALSKLRACWITGRLHFDDCGKSAFMYSVLLYRSTFDKSLPSYMQAGQFNANGKGDAKS